MKRIKNFFKNQLVQMALIAILTSCFTSMATYYHLRRQIPQFATVDLLYLNNEFIMRLAKHQMDKGLNDQEIAALVKNYSHNIEPLLNEISREGNVVLLQKQALISKSKDITGDIEKAILSNFKE